MKKLIYRPIASDAWAVFYYDAEDDQFYYPEFYYSTVVSGFYDDNLGYLIEHQTYPYINDRALCYDVNYIKLCNTASTPFHYFELAEIYPRQLPHVLNNTGWIMNHSELYTAQIKWQQILNNLFIEEYIIINKDDFIRLTQAHTHKTRKPQYLKNTQAATIKYTEQSKHTEDYTPSQVNTDKQESVVPGQTSLNNAAKEDEIIPAQQRDNNQQEANRISNLLRKEHQVKQRKLIIDELINLLNKPANESTSAYKLRVQHIARYLDQHNIKSCNEDLKNQIFNLEHFTLEICYDLLSFATTAHNKKASLASSILKSLLNRMLTFTEQQYQDFAHKQQLINTVQRLKPLYEDKDHERFKEIFSFIKKHASQASTVTHTPKHSEHVITQASLINSQSIATPHLRTLEDFNASYLKNGIKMFRKLNITDTEQNEFAEFIENLALSDHLLTAIINNTITEITILETLIEKTLALNSLDFFKFFSKALEEMTFTALLEQLSTTLYQKITDKYTASLQEAYEHTLAKINNNQIKPSDIRNQRLLRYQEADGKNLLMAAVANKNIDLQTISEMVAIGGPATFVEERATLQNILHVWAKSCNSRTLNSAFKIFQFLIDAYINHLGHKVNNTLHTDRKANIEDFLEVIPNMQHQTFLTLLLLQESTSFELVKNVIDYMAANSMDMLTVALWHKDPRPISQDVTPISAYMLLEKKPKNWLPIIEHIINQDYSKVSKITAQKAFFMNNLFNTKNILSYSFKLMVDLDLNNQQQYEQLKMLLVRRIQLRMKLNVICPEKDLEWEDDLSNAIYALNQLEETVSKANILLKMAIECEVICKSTTLLHHVFTDCVHNPKFQLDLGIMIAYLIIDLIGDDQAKIQAVLNYRDRSGSNAITNLICVIGHLKCKFVETKQLHYQELEDKANKLLIHILYKPGIDTRNYDNHGNNILAFAINEFLGGTISLKSLSILIKNLEPIVIKELLKKVQANPYANALQIAMIQQVLADYPDNPYQQASKMASLCRKPKPS